MLQPGRWDVERTRACVSVLSSLERKNAHGQAPAFMVQLKVKLITPADSPLPAVLHGLSSGLRHFDFPLIKIAEQKGNM